MVMPTASDGRDALPMQPLFWSAAWTIRRIIVVRPLKPDLAVNVFDHMLIFDTYDPEAVFILARQVS